MLRGSACPGEAFQLQPSTNSYQLAEGMHVEHLSLGALRRLLGRFAACGTDMHRSAASKKRRLMVTSSMGTSEQCMRY